MGGMTAKKPNSSRVSYGILIGTTILVIWIILHSDDTKNFISNHKENMLPLLGACVLLSIIPIYLLPWVVSVSNGHPSKTGIFVLNLFLGWTFIGWVVALVWAFTKPQPPQQVIVYQNTPAQSGSLDISHPSEGLSDDLHNQTG